MIDREHKLSVARQANLLGFSRGNVYYSPRPVPDGDLALMRWIDELHLDYPFAGSRMLQGLLRGEGLETGRIHVAMLMKKMGIEAIYRRPNTSKPAPGHKIYPYLLRKLAVTRTHQVWAMDLTYFPMARGFVYLCAVVDWFSRKVLSWRLSITMEAAFCIEAVEEALARHGRPEISAQCAALSRQYRPGIAVHLHRLHLRAEEVADRHLDGWQGRMARQRLRRAALAVDQIRGGLPPRLQDRVRGPHWHRSISDLLQ
ncbi:integrase core domain protein (plasmid) [Agrobacterium sp. RAC06]|nr:integrase core domain protein [Agrobacterium sp. RAC06]